jgi:phenylacetate-coenzyme A ligase PaaK-like adenylate-forming protein
LGKYYLDQYVVCHTSGSQGQPALIVQDKKDLMLTFALNMARGSPMPKRWRTFLARLWNRTRWATLSPGPGFYPSGVAFAYMPAPVRRFAQTLRLSLFDPLAENVAKLNAFRPNFLNAYASVLEMLAREEREGRLRLRQAGCLRLLTNTSEPLSPASRTMIADTFGVHVSDHYAMGECMALSVGCPFAPGSHVNVDLAVLEVVDDQYQLVPPGEKGSKVLVTSLSNTVQPFIRYEVGDVIAMSPQPCQCGSDLPLIQTIEGRTKDRFWVEVKGGYREVSPFFLYKALIPCLELDDYQYVQVERNRLLLRAAPVPGKSLSAARLRDLVEAVLKEDGLAEQVTLEVQIVETIKPDPTSGKRKRLHSLIGPPADQVPRDVDVRNDD